MNNRFHYFLSKYLNHYLLETVGLSHNSVKTYGYTFKLLFIFAKEKYNLKPKKITFETLDKEFILEFSRWLTNIRQSSNRTKNLRLGNIKAFFSYIQTEMPSMVLQAQKIMQIPKKKVEQKVIDYITLDGIKLILNQPNIMTNLGRKHLVILSFMYATGARVQEVVDVTIEDFKYNSSLSVKLVGKGNKARLIPLESEIIMMLEKYIENERRNRLIYNVSDPLFLNKSGKKLTRQGISYIVKKYATMAINKNSTLVPKNIHPHTFRHSRAMALLQAGVELIYIRDFLGHYSVTTTEIYARVNNESTRQALLKVSSQSMTSEVPVWNQNKNLLEFLKDLSE
jgi:site-specific recombinase XerD